MKRLIVAIIDNKSGDTVPQTMLWIHKHLATAVRMYGDVANDPKGQIHHHMEDYDLVQLGEINSQNEITPAYEILMTGQAFKASLQTRDTENEVAIPIRRN